MINTNNILVFSIGVVFTIFFNLIVNKEPFEINSDSISALANVGTFIVALVAALQVKKWLDNKINETAFNKSEEFITELSRFNYRISVVLNCLAKIPTIESDKDYLSFKQELALLHGISDKELEDLFTSFELFNNWGIRFTLHEEVSNGLFDAGYAIGVTEAIINAVNNSDNLKDFKEFSIDMDLFLEKANSAMNYLSKVINIPFSEKFHFTSPSKKVDQ